LKVINDLVYDASDNRRMLEHWFPALSSREQILALGLSFFDGIFDDQFFAAMDKIVENAWKRRDPSISLLDYCDLDNLRTFFDFYPSEGYGIKIIKCRIPEQRQLLFDIAWNSHRRLILSALPIMVQLAARSVADRSFNHELYGSVARRDQLRIVIGEALSDIGLISQSSIQRSLIQLAKDPNLGVQAVAARAMARWRKPIYGRDKELFMMLRNWNEGSKDYMRATVALTVSYASRYDSQNELDEELCKILEDLANDQNPLVRNRFCTHTLPYVVPFHLIKLEKSLNRMTQYIDLIPEIAKSLAVAYRYDDNEVLEILKKWRQECRSWKSSQITSNEINLREKLLATVALTYGYINYKETGKFTANEAFEEMQSILADEKHPFVRQNVIIAISQQSSTNFEKVEPLLQKLVVEIVESESNEIIDILKNIYLEQRKKLVFSNDCIEIDGAQYPVWIYSDRPQTAIEKSMYNWIKSPNNPAAQQIALRSFVLFAKALDIQEEQKILQIRKQRAQYDTMPKPTPNVPTPFSADKLVKKNKLIEEIAIWLATIGAKHYYPIIQGLLPEVLVQNKSNKQVMAFVFEKWHRGADNEISTIAKLQSRAINFIEHSAILIGVPVLAILVLLIIGSVPHSILIAILLFSLVILLAKKYPNQVKIQERMKSLPLKQNALNFWEKLNRLFK
jgi:hypothetical protein